MPSFAALAASQVLPHRTICVVRIWCHRRSACTGRCRAAGVDSPNDGPEILFKAPRMSLLCSELCELVCTGAAGLLELTAHDLLNEGLESLEAYHMSLHCLCAGAAGLLGCFKPYI